jgi:outer membrane protein OmpA-like peptidoglycan-associated protein
MLMPQLSIAQLSNDAGLWIGAGGGYAIYLSSIAAPGVIPVTGTDCAPFTSGTGGGAIGAISADWRFDPHYSILFRAAFSPSNVTMDGQLAATTKDATGNIVPLQLHEQLTVKSNNFILDILPTIRMGQVRGMLGATVLLNTGMNWGVVSTISTPANVTFINGSRTNQILPQSSVPNSNTLLFGLTAGAGLDLPLSSRLSLSPEVAATYFLNSVKSDISWKQTSISFIASLRYHLGCNIPAKRRHATKIDTLRIDQPNPNGPEFLRGSPYTITELTTGECQPDTLETLRRTDTLFKSCLPLTANVQMYAIDEEGRQSLSNLNQIHIEMEYVLDKIPLLPYIFFDSGSSRIPPRYLENNSGEPDRERSTSVDLNHQLFGILGARLQASRSAKIVIRGYVDSAELRSMQRLGTARAKAVGTYLAEHWNIPTNRIQIDSLTDRLPPSPTISALSAGRAENRRVEILSSNGDILSPEDRDSILEPGVIDPSAVVVKTDGSSTEGLTRTISAVQLQGKVLFDSLQTTLPAPHVVQITPALAIAAENGDPLSASLSIRDSCNFTKSAIATAIVNKDTSKYSVHRFTLVNFRIGSAELSAQDTAKLHAFFSGLQAADLISIKGYTDYLGSSSENMQLSQQRADAIANYIQHSWHTGTIVSKYGVADREYVFGISSYDLPEERFLSRTVVIEVKHKL